MRFLSMIRVEETDQRPSERLMTEMGKLIEEMNAAGVLLDTAGLQPSAKGKRIRNNRGKFSAMDGPFAETKEVIGGFAILKADSMAEAEALTRRFLEVHADEWNVECEVRQIEEPDPA